ncbi:hypothetical protein [uncultured Thiodictyon sp.]|uniref:hypothetical protein n=1 Tax=uncultured Thiodictyon sp. TaxID=1846217 RepID=UPI0025E7BBCD|nr:hypothetical protein [uncultured Thiodictyon sp.]
MINQTVPSPRAIKPSAPQNQYQQVMDNCMMDKDARQKFLVDPTGTLKANGVAVPAGVSVSIVRNTNTALSVAIPHSGGQLATTPLINPLLSSVFPCMFGGLQTQMMEQQNQMLSLYAAQQKAQADRARTLEGLRNAVARIDSEMHKNRCNTAMEINRNIQQLLIGGG